MQYDSGSPIAEYNGLPAAINDSGEPLIARNGNPVAMGNGHTNPMLVVKSGNNWYEYSADISTGGHKLLTGDGSVTSHSSMSEGWEGQAIRSPM